MKTARRWHPWRRCWLVGLAVVGSFPGLAEASVDTARDLLAKRDYPAARAEYERLLQGRPQDARLAYNAGVAAFRMQDWDGAAKHFEGTLGAEDLALQQRSYFNLGNTRVRQGELAEDPTEKQRLWTEAARQFEAALGLNAADLDARANLETVRQQLAALPPPDPQQQKQKPDKSKQPEKSDKSEKSDESQKSDSGEKDPSQSPEQDPNSKSDPADGKPDSKDQNGKDKQKGKGKGQDKPDQDKKDDPDGQDQGKDQESGKDGKPGESGKDPKGAAPEMNQSGKPEGKPSGGKPGPKPGEGKPSGEGEPQPGEAGGPGQGAASGAEGETPEGQMAVRFAERLLDGQKSEERALIWRPAAPSRDGNPVRARRKTW
jgi:Ca-activated chloride channel family protein